MRNELRKLSATELLNQTHLLITKEREICLQVIEHLEEIERRRLYLERGYSSLFQMCLTEFRYTESQAFRRISAMRVAREIPETKSALQDGSLNLATVSMAAAYFRKEKAEAGRALPKTEKMSILEELKGKSKREAEQVLQSKSATESLPKFRFETELSPEQEAKLKRVQELVSHSIPPGESGLLLERLLDLALKRLDPEIREKKREAKHPGKSQIEAEAAPIPLSPGKVESRQIPIRVRDQLWMRARGRCEYVDPASGRRCESKHFLQVDHRHPKALGGTNAPENLRMLCGGHNRLKARDSFGARKMSHYWPAMK